MQLLKRLNFGVFFALNYLNQILRTNENFIQFNSSIDAQ